MTLYALKPRFQGLLRPLVARLAGVGVTANQVTVAAAAGSVAIAGVVIWNAERRIVFLLLPAWLLARMALNAIDGMLAREFGQKSRLGAYLNELTDVVSDAALYLPFALVPPFSPLWTGIVIVLAVLSEYAGALGPLIGASRRFDGPMGKSDRAFVFGALGLTLGLGAPPGRWLEPVLWVVAALVALTVVNRVRAALRETVAADLPSPVAPPR